MNKKMRELFKAMQDKLAEVKTLTGDNAADKKQALLDEIAKLQKEFDTEKSEYETEKALAALAAQDEEEQGASKDFQDKKAADIKAFADYIRSEVTKTSTPQNISMGNNGAIIPTTIANKIITAVNELSPIVANCTQFHTAGKLEIPVYGDATDGDDNAHNITVAFADEFSELTADAGKFTSVELTGYLTGALTLIGRSVINNTDIDIVNFVVSQMGRKIAVFLSDKYLNGQSNKCTGALTTTTNLNAGSTSAITGDNLIDLQLKIASAYQKDACWTMNSNTLGTLRKLKYSDGRYMLQEDNTSEFPYKLLGKPINVDEHMPSIGSGNKPILYGDYKGLASNFREAINVQVLSEKFATQHAIGIVVWFEFDTKVMDNAQLATLTMSV